MRYLLRFNFFLIPLCFFSSGCFNFRLGGDDIGALKTSLGSCAPNPCVQVDIAALPKLPPSIVGDTRLAIESEIRRVLYAPLDVDNAKPSRDGVIAELKERLREYDAVSDARIEWSLTRTARVIFSDSKIYYHSHVSLRPSVA